jgi:hypothetical protein
MVSEINLKAGGKPFLGTRFLGRGLRAQLEKLLDVPGDVRINFGHIGVTQSFLDEFVGVLVVRSGQPLIDRLIFAECSRDARALLELVIGARLEDHERLSAKGRASARHNSPSQIRA